MSAAIRIVLVDTSHPGNIGASARAMKNMGLESLVLVRPQAYPDAEATARASGRGGPARRGRGCARASTRRSATAGSCSGRRRGRAAQTGACSMRARAPRRLAAAAAAKPVAILFGGERNGLANEALERCQALIRIPADDAYDALNLAQAVQVVCYEIRMAMAGRDASSPAASAGLATADEMQALQVHVERVMRIERIHARGQRSPARRAGTQADGARASRRRGSADPARLARRDRAAPRAHRMSDATGDPPVYLDYAATAPLDARVAAVMADCLSDPALAGESGFRACSGPRGCASRRARARGSRRPRHTRRRNPSCSRPARPRASTSRFSAAPAPRARRTAMS